jgi:L-amino acid N-acyltransferase YncA
MWISNAFAPLSCTFKMAPEVRPATEADLLGVLAIYNHYVLHTVTSFLVQEANLNYVQDRFLRTKERGLPYFVAVQNGQVVGYAYASPFRGFMLGYGHTVEITIFLHPIHTKKGLGSQMMKALLDALRIATHISREAGHEDKPVEFEVWNVMAIMSIDNQSEDGKFGMALKEWYEKWGFKVVGRLEGVGEKKGRRLDTMYMELQLQ